MPSISSDSKTTRLERTPRGARSASDIRAAASRVERVRRLEPSAGSSRVGGARPGGTQPGNARPGDNTLGDASTVRGRSPIKHLASLVSARSYLDVSG
jgi:hypothetical protein